MANKDKDALKEPLVWSEYETRDVSLGSKPDDHIDIENEYASEMGVRPNGTNTVFGAVASFVSIAMGAGILSVPGAIKRSGWSGIAIILAVASLAHFTSLLLIRCLHMVPGKRLFTYEELGEAVWGSKGRFIVSIYQSVTLFGVATIFLILIGGNLVALLKSQPTVGHFTDHLWLIFVGLLLLPLTWLRKLTDIKWLSTLGVVSSSTVAALVTIGGISHGVQNPATHHAVTDASDTIECLNIVLFSFCVHSFVPSIETSMAEPEKWPRVSALAFSFVALINITVAASAYYGFGTDVKENVLETSSLNGTIATVSLVFITIAVTAQYPLPMNPVSLFFEELFGINVDEKAQDKKENEQEAYYPIGTDLNDPSNADTGCCSCSMRAKSILLRSGLVLFTIVIGCLVPFFAQVLALLSSLVLVGPALTFPQVFYVILKRRRKEHISITMYIVIGFSLCIAAFATIAGSIIGVEKLMLAVSQNHNPFANFFWNPNVNATAN